MSHQCDSIWGFEIFAVVGVAAVGARESAVAAAAIDESSEKNTRGLLW